VIVDRDRASSPSAREPYALAARIAFGATVVLYPVVVWYGISRGNARATAAVLLCATIPLALLRWRSVGARALHGLGILPFVTVAMVGLGLLLGRSGFVLAVPTAVNVVLLAVFAATLQPGSTPMIERFARLQVADPSPRQMAWCRAWTWIWCAFFVVNGGTATALALWSPTSWWAAYTGGIAYLGIGSLLLLEWLLRRRRFRES
jgi:uncharacterized membrane protein